MMGRIVSLVGLLVTGAWAGGGSDLRAQELAAAERAPRFYLASPASSVLTDASGVSALRRRVSVDLDRVPLSEALETISTRANLRLVYSRDLLREGARVSLKADNITVTAALTEVLLDVGLDVVVSPTGQMTLVRRLPREAPPAVITGRVTDEKTGEGLAGAYVELEGTERRTRTGMDGRYRLGGVAPGNYTLTVRRLGYAKQSKPLAVADDARLVMDVALDPMPTQLDQVVTTVTGGQRIRELGHVVGRINADSLVKEAPVSSVTELLTGRIPGVQVFQSQGVVGGDVQLQLRTPNSFLLSTQPIVIVDGVRYTSTPAFDQARAGQTAYRQPGAIDRGPTAALVEATSPLNDLNPNDIETIEVVKGSAAATLYGTDAINGVIVVTTKRGRPGPARWNAYVRSGVNETPKVALPEAYFAWGTRPDGLPFAANCSLARVAEGECTQDSIAAYVNPLEDPAQTIFGSAPVWEYGLNVSGGRPTLRYYVGGSFQQETGSLRMPRAFVDSMVQARGLELPDEQLRPNALRNLNLQSNLTGSLGERFELQGTLGYTRRTNRTISLVVNPYESAGDLGNDPTDPWGGGGSPSSSPDNAFSRTSTEQVDRFRVSGGGSWRPMHWLQARATAGVDLASGGRHSLTRRGEAFGNGNPESGEVQTERTQQRAISGDLGLTASFTRRRLSSRTSVGAQYVRSVNDVQIARGADLMPGGESVPQAANRFADQLYSETITLGSYAEQTFGLNDRLFLTGALRVDGASNFGHDYEAAAYPKGSVSWIVSEEPFLPRVPGLGELRLRYAFGASGQQAYPWMTLPTFAVPGLLGPAPALIEGTRGTLITVTALGNEHLRPERAYEHEFGFDAAALGDRLRLGLAWYRRRIVDQIAQQTLAPGMGSIYTNLGLTRARGVEADLHVQLLDGRGLSWAVSASHSSNSTLLVDIGDGVEQEYSGYKEGYPLGADFQRPVLGYEDVNGDGVLALSELRRSDTLVYMGPGTPPRSQTLTSTVGLFDRRLRLSASLNRSAGQVLTPQSPCLNDQCLALLDPSTPLAEQAEAHASRLRPVRGDFTRLNEVTVALDLPAGLLRALSLRSALVSVSARNLALWTSFPGGDPGSVRVTALTTSSVLIPQAREWTFRFDVGL